MSLLDTKFNKSQRRGADSSLSAEDVHEAAPSNGFTSFNYILQTNKKKIILVERLSYSIHSNHRDQESGSVRDSGRNKVGKPHGIRT